MTVSGTGLLDELRKLPEVEVLDTSDRKVSREEKHERRRRALLVDLFFSGTNAVTASWSHAGFLAVPE